MKIPKLGRILTYEEFLEDGSSQFVRKNLIPWFGKIVEVEEWEEGDNETYIAASNGQRIWVKLTEFKNLAYKVGDMVIYTPKEDPNIKISAFVKGFTEDQIQIVCKDVTSGNLVIRTVPYDSLYKVETGGNSQ